MFLQPPYRRHVDKAMDIEELLSLSLHWDLLPLRDECVSFQRPDRFSLLQWGGPGGQQRLRNVDAIDARHE